MDVLERKDLIRFCSRDGARCNKVLALKSLSGTDFYESEMALISERMEYCAKRVLDSAGVVTPHHLNTLVLFLLIPI